MTRSGTRRGQPDPLEAAQLEHRPGDGRLLVPGVELDDLVAGREPVFVTSTRIVTTSPDVSRMLLSTRRWSIANVAYDRPWPNGQSGDDGPST
jgi:hypothetical protein